MPSELGDSAFCFCRRLGVAAKVLRGNRWILQMLISTATVDKRTIKDYYRRGEVAMLGAMIEAKRANRLTRRNRTVAVRVLKDASTPYQFDVSALELDDPEVIIGHGSLSRYEQAALWRSRCFDRSRTIRRSSYGKRLVRGRCYATWCSITRRKLDLRRKSRGCVHIR